jgi:hypothetical protein
MNAPRRAMVRIERVERGARRRHVCAAPPRSDHRSVSDSFLLFLLNLYVPVIRALLTAAGRLCPRDRAPSPSGSRLINFVILDA